MYGRGRRAAGRGNLIVGQTAEIVQLDHLGQSRLHLLQTLERFVERNHVDAGRRRNGVLRGGLPNAPAARLMRDRDFAWSTNTRRISREASAKK